MMENELGSYEVGNCKPPKDTQFGGVRANPHSSELGVKPWSIKNSLRDMAHRDLTYSEVKGMSEEELIEILLSPFKRVTQIQIGAARQIARYAKSCTDAQFISEQIDGKVANINLNAEAKNILEMNDEQLDDYIASNLAKIGSQPSNNGEKPAGGSETATS